MSPLSESAALCRVHPGAAAVLACARCGSFSCEECRSSSHPGLCQSCSGREGAGLGQDAGAAGLLRDAFGLLVTNLPAVAVVAAILLSWQLLVRYVILPALGANVPLLWDGRDIPPIYNLGSLLLMLITSAGFMRWVADGLLHAEDRTLAPAVRAAWRRAPSLGLMWLCYGLAAVCGLVLLVVPGLYLLLCHSLAPAALVIDSHGSISALHQSRGAVVGHRLSLLIMWAPLLVLSYVASGLGGVLTIVLVREGPLGELVALVSEMAILAFIICLLEIATVLAYLRFTRRRMPPPASATA